MARRIAFAMARQIHGEDGMALRQSFHVPAPAERSTEQSMQQQKRRPCSGAEIANSVSGDLCCKFLDLHGSPGNNRFSISDAQKDAQ